MKYLKNSSIAKKYQVSDPTVGKWIRLAQQDKNNLELKKVKNRHYIIDNEANHQVLRFLSDRGAKYRNKIGYEKVNPDPEIYKTFNESQLIELIINLKKKNLPTKFTYFGGGAKYWYQATTSNSDYYQNKTVRNINSSLEYIITRLGKYEHVNIVDFNPETAYPARTVIQRLLKENINVSYSALHASSFMLENTKKEICSNFRNIQQTYKTEDIEYSIIRDDLYKSKNLKKNSCNLILFLECAIGNHTDRNNILKNFSNSMSKGDYLLIDAEIKSAIDFELVNKFLNTDVPKDAAFWTLNNLGVNQSMFDFQVKYIEKIDSQAHIYKFKKDVDIEFYSDFFDEVVSFRQGDELMGISIHSFSLNELISELEKASFNISHFSCYPDVSEVLAMCEVLEY
jgi:hypothetical protein